MMAKSLAAGLPLSAVVGKAAIMDAPLAGGLGGTYAGNPLACAAALAVLDVFEDERIAGRAMAHRRPDARGACCDMQARVPRDRRRPRARAHAGDRAGDGSGDEGAGCGIGAPHHRPAARDGGLLLLKCGPHKNVVRLLPPLTTTAQEMSKGIDILRKVVRESGRTA